MAIEHHTHVCGTSVVKEGSTYSYNWDYCRLYCYYYLGLLLRTCFLLQLTIPIDQFENKKLFRCVFVNLRLKEEVRVQSVLPLVCI